MRPRTFRFRNALLALALVAPAPAAAIPNFYTENFSTTAFRDTAATTANWNAAFGGLSLFGFQPSLLGATDTPGSAGRVTLAGGRAYVADATSGVQILGLTNPSAPVVLGAFDTPDAATDIAVVGRTVYVADFSTGLLILDATNPAAPVQLGSFNTPGVALDVAVAGGVAYIADHTAGLRILNVTNPAAPISIGTFAATESRGVAVVGATLYLADGVSGLRIIDVTNPAAPVQLGIVDTPNNAWSVTVEGRYAYVADRTSGLQIVDVSNPASPVIVGSFDTLNLANEVVLWGSNAYVADGGTGVVVLDVSNPAVPAFVRTIDTPDFASGLAWNGEHFYVADRTTGLQVVYANIPWASSLLSNPHLGTEDVLGEAYDVAVVGRHAFVASGTAGLRIYDVSDPVTPTFVGAYDTPGLAQAVEVVGGRAYVASGAAGLWIINVTTPAAPALLGTLATGDAQGITVEGTIAFVAGGVNGLLMINVANPASPTPAGIFDTPGNATDVVVEGTTAYVADGAGGLRIVNVATPGLPVALGAVAGTFEAIAVSGHLAFVSGAAGYAIYNVSNPAAPALVAGLAVGTAPDIAVQGNLMGVLTTTALRVYDVRVPTAPLLLFASALGGDAHGTTLSGPIAYVTDATTLQTVELMQDRINVLKDTGQSLDIAVVPASDQIIRARVLPEEHERVLWSLYNAGLWLPAVPGQWVPVSPTSDMRWRAVLRMPNTPAWYLQVPQVENVMVEWLLRGPHIDAVTDVGGDQGRQVRLTWDRSGYDFDNNPDPITEYTIYRRIDGTAPSPVHTAKLDDPERREMLVLGWDYVATVPAEAEDGYSYVAPTLGDSTPSAGQRWSVFMVRARTATPSVHHDSQPDSGYSIDNLSPNVPLGLALVAAGGARELSWDDPVDADFRYFNLYRSNNPAFVPEPSNRVHSTTGTSWTDASPAGGTIVYKLTAVDFAGNESAPATTQLTVDATGTMRPARFDLHAASPNPFRLATAIAYDVPEGGGAVRLGVFDLGGRRLRQLVDGDRPAGAHRVTWDGCDDGGRPLPAGLYLCRMEAPGFTHAHKVLLAR